MAPLKKSLILEMTISSFSFYSLLMCKRKAVLYHRGVSRMASLLKMQLLLNKVLEERRTFSRMDMRSFPLFCLYNKNQKRIHLLSPWHLGK